MSMLITLIQIGKTKHRFFQEASEEYLKRLQPFCKLNIITLKEQSFSKETSENDRMLVKKKEGQEILKHLPADNFVVVLDEHGKKMDSLTFAAFLKGKKDESRPLTFIMGGPYGLDPGVLAKAHLQLSFSDFTFTHEMIRVLLLEQLYRGFMIGAQRKYHY